MDALEEFESDDGAAKLLGGSWLGLETKFRLIEYGIKVRKYLIEQVGRDLTVRLLQIPEKDTHTPSRLRTGGDQAAARDCGTIGRHSRPIGQSHRSYPE